LTWRARGSGGLPAGKPLSDLGDSLRHPALLGEGPVLWEQAASMIMGDALLSVSGPWMFMLIHNTLTVPSQGCYDKTMSDIPRDG